MTSSNPLRQLNDAGQSVWYDHIHRRMLGAELQTMIARDDLRGITSNPSIFEKAIGAGDVYDDAIRTLLETEPGLDAEGIFQALAVADIQAAADQLLPVYELSEGVDGRVSLEVSPQLAHDTEGTLREARQLAARVDRPNLMIKVPATEAGIPAVETLIFEGISVNVTLLFAVARYQAMARAFLRGMQRRLEAGLPVNRVASVASFFVSRVDGAVDPLLGEDSPWAGRIAIANARLAYACYRQLFDESHFGALRTAGAHPQRLLWASTSTKNPAYRDVIYVEELIGPDTVNTLPPATYEAFLDHGRVAHTLDRGLPEAETAIAALTDLDIDLDAITARLETEGVVAFASAYDNLLAAIRRKAAALAA